MTELSVSSILILLLTVFGVALILIASIGLLRMPDLYLRTSVASKGSTLGIASIMLAVALYFGELGTSSRAIAVVIFMMLTAPVAAHMLGRSAYRDGVSVWSEARNEDNLDSYTTKRNISKGVGLD